MIRTPTTEETRNALAELFVAAAGAIASRLARNDLPMTAQMPRTWVMRDGEGGMRTDQRDEPRHILTRFEVEYAGAPWLTEVEVAQIGQCASMLLDQWAATLPFCAAAGGRAWFLVESLKDRPEEPPDFERDPGDWVSRLLIQPAMRYHLLRMSGADQADAEAANAFADDVLDVARASDLKYVTFVPLSGLDIAPPEVKELHDGDLTVRRLSEQEQGDWFDGGSEKSLWRLDSYAEPPRVVVEIRSSGPRNDWYQPPRHSAARLIAAFHLHDFRVAGSIVADSADPPWTGWGRHSGPLMVPHYSTGLSSLTTDTLHQVVATSKLLERYNLQEPQSPKDLALHRFASGLARASATDAVLDFIIALEALLLPNDPSARHGDLSYRFRVHGAHYLSVDTAERVTTFSRMRNLYNVRSLLVHGGRYPSASEIQQARGEAHELARRGLLRALQEGFPTADMFRSMVLGGTDDHNSD